MSAAAPLAAPVFLNAMGVSCALGRGAAAVATALFDASAPGGLTCSERYSPGRPLMLGEVTAALPSLQTLALRWRSRNNALLLDAWEQIAAPVLAARERFGARRLAVIIGTSTSGIGEAERALEHSQAGVWSQEFHYAQQEIGAAAGFLSQVAGARGPAYTVSTACSSGAKALAAGARLLQAGLVDAVLAGGGDSLCRFTLEGFCALEAVAPQRCLPFSRHRAGINIGEGAALFLMTRTPGPVRLCGWGESADAYHMSAPDPEAGGAMIAIRQALQQAGVAADALDYVNLHGTATLQNDAMEARAVAQTLGTAVRCSSTKPLTGHALGASGAIEAALCWLTLAHNPGCRLPPHWFDGAYDPALPRLALVAPGESAAAAPRHVMSLSFAFGGSNVALLLGAG